MHQFLAKRHLRNARLMAAGLLGLGGAFLILPTGLGGNAVSTDPAAANPAGTTTPAGTTRPSAEAAPTTIAGADPADLAGLLNVLAAPVPKPPPAPVASTDPTPETPPAPVAAAIRFAGSILGPSYRRAILVINEQQRMVAEGDAVENETVDAIHADRVVLRTADGERREVGLAEVTGATSSAYLAKPATASMPPAPTPAFNNPNPNPNGASAYASPASRAAASGMRASEIRKAAAERGVDPSQIIRERMGVAAPGKMLTQSGREVPSNLHHIVNDAKQLEAIQQSNPKLYSAIRNNDPDIQAFIKHRAENERQTIPSISDLPENENEGGK